MKFNLHIHTGGGRLSSHHKRSTWEYMNPVRDWTVGLGLGAMLFVAGVSFIVLDFYNQFGVTAPEAVLSEQPITYREKEVKLYAEQYAEKERRFNALRKVHVFHEAPVSESQDAGVESIPEGVPVAE